LSRYTRIDGLAISAIGIAIAIAIAGMTARSGWRAEFAREILTEEDGNLNRDQVRLNRIHFSRGKWPTFVTSLPFIHPAIGRTTRMRRVRAADRPGSAPRDPFLIQMASFAVRDGVERLFDDSPQSVAFPTAAEFTAFRGRPDGTRLAAAGSVVDARCSPRQFDPPLRSRSWLSPPIRGWAARSAVGVCVWKSAPLCADPRSVPSAPFAAALSGLGATARIDAKG
jgi:hypothetical protein